MGARMRQHGRVVSRQPIQPFRLGASKSADPHSVGLSAGLSALDAALVRQNFGGPPG